MQPCTKCNTVVYGTANGKMFHTKECRPHYDPAYPLLIEEARDLGFGPCSHCHVVVAHSTPSGKMVRTKTCKHDKSAYLLCIEEARKLSLPSCSQCDGAAPVEQQNPSPKLPTAAAGATKPSQGKTRTESAQQSARTRSATSGTPQPRENKVRADNRGTMHSSSDQLFGNGERATKVRFYHKISSDAAAVSSHSAAGRSLLTHVLRGDVHKRRNSLADLQDGRCRVSERLLNLEKGQKASEVDHVFECQMMGWALRTYEMRDILTTLKFPGENQRAWGLQVESVKSAIYPIRKILNGDANLKVIETAINNYKGKAVTTALNELDTFYFGPPGKIDKKEISLERCLADSQYRTSLWIPAEGDDDLAYRWAHNVMRAIEEVADGSEGLCNRIRTARPSAAAQDVRKRQQQYESVADAIGQLLDDLNVESPR